MSTPAAWQDPEYAARLRRYADPLRHIRPSADERPTTTGLFDAIGFALLETEHMDGAQRVPHFLWSLAKAGYLIVPR